MTNKGNCFVSIVILLLGVVFCWFSGHDHFTRWIVLLCGLAFVVPAAVSILGMFVSGKAQRMSALMRVVQIICGVAGLVLGLCIIFMPDVFRSLLFYPFGALLVAGGLFQEFQVSHRNRPVDYPGWLHVVPVLLIAAGVVLLCVPALHELSAERWMLLMVGISAILFGVNGICVSVMARRLPKRLKEGEAAEPAKEEAPKAAETPKAIAEAPATEPVKPAAPEAEEASEAEK